ncbi:copper chaperone PCu(A)C [Glycomyces sp. A-F 0318]|uniref:copper chaperone PCu(A)C n=1 Tax=Glycomyces amatae TaxID=2881355 RepID=UPI001E431885|nr:copper chaperone PCu(A)C [Glycomyces amatae]MCD0443679.1 copper chaperone PCu(A)C [Glycomyces amatae]
MRKTRHTPTLPARTAAALLGLGLLAACGTEPDADEAAETAEATAAESVVITDAWVKTTEEDMTALFGVLENASGTEAHLVSAESDLGTVELHEVVEAGGAMVMQEVPDGFLVPAEGEHELTPGGDHIMLMGLAAPVVAGDEVAVTLRFEDGSELAVTAVAKDFEGGDEEYRPGGTDGM